MNSLPRLGVTLLLTTLIISTGWAQTRYWVSGAAANWSSNSWAASSGGAADGGGPPTAGQAAVFDGNGLGNCTVDVAAGFDGMTMAAAYTGAVDLNGQVFAISGTNNNSFAGGTINDTPGTSTLSINTTGTTTFSGTAVNATVNATTGLLYLNGSNFTGSFTADQTGNTNTSSTGGNTFTQNVIITNSGGGYVLLGNGSSDDYQANLTFNNTGTYYMYLAYASAGNTVGGTLTLNNSGTGQRIIVANNAGSDLTVTGNATINNTSSAASSYMYIGVNGNVDFDGNLTVNNSATSATTGVMILANGTASTVTVDGTLDVTNSSSGTAQNTYIGNSGDVTAAGDLTIVNSGTGTTSQVLIANGADSDVQVDGTLDATNSGTGTTSRIYLANNGDIICNGQVDVTTSSGSTNSQIYCNHVGTGTYNNDFTVESTNAAGDGFLFGNGGGSATLAATRTLSVEAGGFAGGYMYLRNFTQVGATAQSWTLTGTSYTYLYDCSFGGDVDFTSPQMVTRGTTFSGTASLEKSGATNNNSNGGNTFVGNATLTNSGSANFLMGNGTADDFQSDLDMVNSGSSNLYVAYAGAGHTIGGALTATASGSAGRIDLCGSAGSTLSITGNASATSTSSNANSVVIFGSGGSVTFGGDLTMINNSTGASTNFYVANGTGSVSTVAGNSVFTNNGSGATTNRFWIGNGGDITFTGTVDLNNSSGSTNSEMFIGYAATSAINFNNNITIENTSATGDGIYFGQNGGTVTLAATRTVTVDAGGFVAGQARFRNFTQTGATAHSLTFTGTALYYNYDANWGGDLTVVAPRVLTQGTTYNGTVSFTKNGANNDNSVGGNTFMGVTTLNNTSAAQFLMGNGTADDFQSDLTMNNSGSNNLYAAYTGAGHLIGGNLVMTNSGSGATCQVSVGATGTLAVTGNVTATNTASTAASTMVIGNSGDVTIGGDVTMTNSSTGATTNHYIANAAVSTVNITGNVTITNSGTGATTQRMWLGSAGDITVGGTLDITNTSTATNSEVFCNYTTGSVATYGGDITCEATAAGCDGVRFGQNGGTATLAATRTVNVGVGGFVDGYYYFRNFTQTGATAQNLTCTGTAFIYNYDSDWGGDVDFRAPRMYTRGTTYNGTAHLEKTGATDDASVGGNTFVGEATLVSSGTGYFLMGNGTADDFQSNLIMTNNGDDDLYVAYAGAGHTVAGNVTITSSNMAELTYIGAIAGSTLAIGGNFTATNTTGAANTSIRLAEGAVATVGGDVTITDNSTSATSNNVIAGQAASSATITGNVSLTNGGTGATTVRTWLGNQGDVTIGGTLDIVNSATATNSEVFCNYNPTSAGSYAGNITGSSEAAGCDGIRFGQNGGTAVLAATRTVNVGAGGFVDGQYQFRNFTQTGPTAQSLTCTGTATIYSYDASWGGNVTFTAPRQYTRGTTYSGTAFIEKNGAGNDASAGGNTFVGNATLNNTGSGYFLMGNGSPDDFQANLDMTNSGSYNMYLAYNSAGNQVAGTFNVTNSGSADYFYISDLAASTLTIGGAMTVNNTSNGPTAYVYIGNAGDIDINSTLDVTNAATGNLGDVRIGNTGDVDVTGAATWANSGSATTTRSYIGTNGNVHFMSTLDVTNSASGTTNFIVMSNGAGATQTIDGAFTATNTASGTNGYMYLGNGGDMVYNSTVDISNNSTATGNSLIYCNHVGDATYNGNVTIENFGASSDGIYFGDANGVGTLVTGQTITLGANGFTNGELRLEDFVQQGGTAQALSLTGTTTLLRNQDSEWNGNVTFDSPRHLSNTTTYNGTAYLEKTAGTNDASGGGNIFNDNATFENSGTGYFMQANGTADDYNGDVTYIMSSTGLLYPCYNAICTYAGNINIDATTTSVYFGAAGNGRATMDGTGAQSINDLSTSVEPRFRDLHMDNPNDELTLNMPVTITVQLDMEQGNIITTTTNLLTGNDNSTVVNASNDSYVDGPIEKIGNEAYDFPVGKSGNYQPISISAPTSGAASFRAEYFGTDPAPSYDDTQHDASIDHISDCEYWILDRTNTTNNVVVTLSYDGISPGCSGVDPAGQGDLVVARWDGATWRDEGNGGTTGTSTNGTVSSAAAITSFSPFTLATITNVNPLPVELVTFDAVRNNDVVDLTWVTATETDNDFFTLHKSLDGVNFEPFRTLNGAGTSLSTLTYTERDYDPSTGVNYYRLTQTDFDGTETDHGTVSVNFTESGSDDILIFPNPASNNPIMIQFGDQQEGTAISVVDAAGKTIWSRTISGTSATIPQETLARGVYFIQITGDNTSSVHELVVQ